VLSVGRIQLWLWVLITSIGCNVPLKSCRDDFRDGLMLCREGWDEPRVSL
jgi:hypothetical protein